MVLQISWSGLRRWEECHMRHKLVITGKRDPVQNGRVFLPGTVSDRIMRAWLESPDPQPGQMAQMVEEYFQRYAVDDPEYVIKWRSPNDMAVTRNFVREVVTNLEPILMEHVLPYEYQPELRFRGSIYIPGLDGLPWRIELVGGIDVATRFVPEPKTVGEAVAETIKLWDLKATANQSYASKVIGQMVFYDICFENFYGIRPEAIGLFMPACKKPVVPLPITDVDRQDMMTRIIRMAHGIWRKEWHLAPDRKPCQYCETKLACPRYATPVSIGEDGKRRVSFDDAVSARAEIPLMEITPLDKVLGDIPILNEPPFGRAEKRVSFDRIHQHVGRSTPETASPSSAA